ncbi:MAG TPA: hypothetical protein VML01_04515 [Bryobacterales bacterium]|nr:hypothetical protein [Bryobacterales bacterium]
MSFIAFPLRLKKAFLDKCDEREAILRLVRIMAQTPNGSWSGDKHFGVRNFFEFEHARRRREASREACEEINKALLDLDITHYRVESLVKEAQTEQDVDSYVVTLASTDKEGEIYTMTV